MLGAGSFRQAIIESNKQPGADTIDFDVAGTIRIGRTSLPAITDTVTIDGTTAPAFAGSPVVTVNFQGTKGLEFAKGADGSTLKSLSLVRAGNAGVTLSASNVTRARQLHRPLVQRNDHRRQSRRRRADQRVVARRPDRADRSGHEHELLSDSDVIPAMAHACRFRAGRAFAHPARAAST